MRTIDADELKKKLEAEHCDCEIMAMIDNMPTAAENVKYGAWAVKNLSRMKWIPDESDDITAEETTIEDMIEQKCSVCQRWSIKFAHHIEMNFCPNCGRKMITRRHEDA